MKTAKHETWMDQAVGLMVREEMNLLQAATLCGAVIGAEEATRLTRKPEFRRMLSAARLRFYEEKAQDPNRTKNAAIGHLMILAEKLTENKDYDKAANVLEKIAKIEGWIGAESNVNLFGGLSQKDLDEIRLKVQIRGQVNAGEGRPN